MTTDAVGFRWPNKPLLSDVALTGDEMIHIAAMWGETLHEVLPQQVGTVHDTNPRDVPIGYPHPECPICCSLMEKAERAGNEAEGLGKVQPFQGPS